MNFFTDKDLYLNKDDQQRKYYRRTDEKKVAVPWGQRKLFMIELEFFSLYWNPDQVPNPIIVYAGAAPGKHIHQLSIMFPNFTFYLWDPRVFELTPSDKIHIYQDYFTDDTAQQWSNRNDVFFISDIRTADYKEINDSYKNDWQILQDMYKQQDWHKIIKPVASLLKFRLPYSDTGLPLKIDYLDGILLKQPWAPQTSTETRLVPYDHSTMKEWDCVKYEEQLFYFNTIVREKFTYYNLFDHSSNLLCPPELVNDYDSTAEAFIISLYLSKYNANPTIDLVSSLSVIITDSINQGKPFKDSLSALRANTRLIKERNAHKSFRKYIHIKIPESSSQGKQSKIIKRLN